MPGAPIFNIDQGEMESRSLPTSRKRRPRTSVACVCCRARKVKCDGSVPCSNCIRHKFQCTYEDVRPRPARSRIARRHPKSSPSHSRSASISQCIATPKIHGTSLTSLDKRLSSVAVDSTVDHTESSDQEQTTTVSDTSPGLDYVNQHTGASEFYGPSGTFYFLSKLRSHASRSLSSINNHTSPIHANPNSSVIDLLQSANYSVTNSQTANARPLRSPKLLAVEDREFRSASGPFSQDSLKIPSSSLAQSEVEIQRECIRLYFDNLHCVHPILDPPTFLRRCEKNAWRQPSKAYDIAHGQDRAKRLFPGLFHIVLALGALTAGGTSLLTSYTANDFLESSQAQATANSPSFAPIRIAQLYFDRARIFLEDVFESTSIETTQTLFLMAVFCQNALKPHSCYMYSGMALRTALAIGLPTASHAKASEEKLLWWALYSFEIEMCSSSGRLSFLQAQNHYTIPLPSITNSEGSLVPFVNYMVGLADIVAAVAANANWVQGNGATEAQSSQCFQLETQLSEWRSNLPHSLNFEEASLSDSFLNTQLLNHRPFLIPNQTREGFISHLHVSPCVAAARNTIQFLHHTYLYRPYFRTWWYNCTYVLDASMVLLYVVLVNACPCPIEEAFADVEKSLEIFEAMDVVSVARMCSKITTEVLRAAKELHLNSQQEEHVSDESDSVLPLERHPQPHGHPGLGAILVEDQGQDNTEATGLNHEELYATLADPNLMYNFLSLEDWNALSGPEGDLFKDLDLS